MAWVAATVGGSVVAWAAGGVVGGGEPGIWNVLQMFCCVGGRIFGWALLPGAMDG